MAFEETLKAIYTYNKNKSREADDLIDRELLSQVLQTMFTEIATTSGDFLPVAGTTGQVLAKASNTDGDVEWVTASGGSGWGLTGNADTIPGTDFIGTSDNTPLEFRINNQRAGYLSRSDSNTSFGYLAFLSNTEGDQNTVIGTEALYNNTTGFNNVANGFAALYNNSAGNDNVASGYQALENNSTGSNNTAAGSGAGRFITTGSNNTAIGNNAQVAVPANSNQVRVGDIDITLAQIQVAWTVTSDERFKNTIQNADLGLDFITSLRPVSYLRNGDVTNKTEYGFIAQELEQALVNAGVTNSGIIAEDDATMLSVRYNDFFAPLVKAIQELKAENEALNARITALEV